MVVNDEKHEDVKEQSDAKQQDDEKQPESEESEETPPPHCFCSFCHGDTEFENDDNVG